VSIPPGDVHDFIFGTCEERRNYYAYNRTMKDNWYEMFPDHCFPTPTGNRGIFTSATRVHPNNVANREGSEPAVEPPAVEPAVEPPAVEPPAVEPPAVESEVGIPDQALETQNKVVVQELDCAGA